MRVDAERLIMRAEKVESSEERRRYYERVDSNELLKLPSEQEFQKNGAELVKKMDLIFSNLRFQAY